MNDLSEKRTTSEFLPETVAQTYTYPVLDVPPVAQAQVKTGSGGEGERQFALNYGGRNIVTITLKNEVKSRIRLHSDSSMQSSPFIQQFYISVPEPACAVVELHMRKEALCLRPRRAQKGEAILAQDGGPLIYGANGFYGIWEDLLVEWHGASWRWQGNRTVRLEDGSTRASFEIRLDTQPFILLLKPRYYGSHLGYRFHAPWEWRPNPKGVSGWCSWEAYHTAVTEKNIADAAKGMSLLVPYGLEYIQLDDGYQQPLIPPEKDGRVADSWLNLNERFPGGHGRIVESIRSCGLTPAIWTNAAVTNEEAADTGLCMQENGKAFKGDWIQFILNCREETLEKHVLPYYQGMKEYGYTYFKTDAIRHLLFDGLHECVRRGLLTDGQAHERFRNFMQCAREGIGRDAYLLSCWGMLSQSVGLADACRVATDANPSWGRIQMQIAEAARCFFAQRILFTIDSDHICARTELEWARMLLSFISVTGGVYMLSDPLECYDEERMRIIKKTLPSLAVFTGETGPLDYGTPAFCWPEQRDQTPEETSRFFFDNGRNTFGSFWAAHFRKDGRSWTVVVRTALLPLAAETISLEEAGLDPDGKYAAYDFWEERFLGVVQGTIGLRELAVGHVQVCSLTPITGGLPVLVGSTRHVSMDAVSVISYIAEEDTLTLGLRGVEGESFTYVFYSEDPCAFVSDRPCSVQSEGPLYSLKVFFDREDAVIVVRKK